MPPSPPKSHKFDINSYFKSVKEEYTLKPSQFYPNEEKSVGTKNTEDNSQKDTASLKYN